MQLPAKTRWFQQCDISRIDLHEQFNVQLDGRTTCRVGGGTCRTNGLPYFLNHGAPRTTSAPLLISFFRLSDGWPELMKERARTKKKPIEDVGSTLSRFAFFRFNFNCTLYTDHIKNEEFS